MNKRDALNEIFDLESLEGEDAPLFADGFDDALIGVDDKTFRAVYSIEKIIDILVKEGASYEEAVEHFDFNIAGSYVGKMTPIYVRTQAIEEYIS